MQLPLLAMFRVLEYLPIESILRLNATSAALRQRIERDMGGAVWVAIFDRSYTYTSYEQLQNTLAGLYAGDAQYDPRALVMAYAVASALIKAQYLESYHEFERAADGRRMRFVHCARPAAIIVDLVGAQSRNDLDVVFVQNAFMQMLPPTSVSQPLGRRIFRLEDNHRIGVSCTFTVQNMHVPTFSLVLVHVLYALLTERGFRYAGGVVGGFEQAAHLDLRSCVSCLTTPSSLYQCSACAQRLCSECGERHVKECVRA